MSIERTQRGTCAVMEFSSPPVNALGRVLAEALAGEIVAVAAEPGVHAIVLVGKGRGFCAGADISELASEPGQADAIRALLQALDASPVPVVAAIHGVAFGGGLELALACMRAWQQAKRNSHSRKSVSACCRAPAAPSAPRD